MPRRGLWLPGFVDSGFTSPNGVRGWAAEADNMLRKAKILQQGAHLGNKA